MYVNLTQDYYQKALDLIKKKSDAAISVFVFSDDLDWCRDNLKSDFKTFFVSATGMKSSEELVLMSKCQHNIIANSSFSWWGAFLNSNLEKIVVGPDQWFCKSDPHFDSNIYPPEWNRL